jgi:peroxiredoxin
MLEPGDPIPDARVWTAPRTTAVPLRDAIAGDGCVLLCFYVFDWSPG